MTMALDLTLYLATDPALAGSRDLCGLVAEAIDNGVTVVQLRDKDADGAALYETALGLLRITRPRSIPLIINDRVDVMLAVGADGIHIGPTDLPLEQVRRLAGKAIVGYSVNTLEDLAIAHRFGADYIGVGPVFPTSTKPDARDVLGLEGLRFILGRTALPAVAIGGVTVENCAQAMACRAGGVCAISAILGAPDTAAVVRDFRKQLKRGRA